MSENKQRNILYECRESLIENKPLKIYAREPLSNGASKFLAEYIGYYRGKTFTVALYPKYNPMALEQSRARKQVISARLIRKSI